MNPRTRKLMTMHMTSHSRDDFYRLYVSKSEVGRRHANVEDSVDALIQRLEDNMKKRGKRLITATKN